MNDLTVVKENKLETVEGEFLQRIQEFEGFACNHLINNHYTYSQADAKISEGELIKKGIKGILDPIVSKRHKFHKEATTFRSKLIDPIESSSQKLMRDMQIFQTQEAERNAAAQKILEDAAKEKQEQECLDQAEEMEKAGMDKEAIDGVLDLAELPGPEVHLATPILRSKTSFTPSWDVEVIDEFLVPEDYIIRTVNLKAIKQIVKDKSGAIEIPGIKITETTATRRNSR